jgi:hypothetical protein
MAVKFTKPEINVREKLAELDKPSGIAGEAMLRAETVAEQQALIGVGRRNLLINGDFKVSQRGTSFTALSNGSAYTCDRWKWEGSGNMAVTIEQSADAPNYFDKSIKVTVTTAESSIAATEFNQLLYQIEGQDIAPLAYGTGDAKPMVFSFWVKSSVTGSFPFSVQNQNGSRVFPSRYTVNNANTWEYKTISISGDTGGTWNTSGNALGLRFTFLWVSGSTYTGGIADGGWKATSVYANLTSTYTAPINTANATLQITGVQMEVGKVATPFEHRSYGEELALCERYYQRVPVYHESIIGQCWNTTSARFPVQLPVEMRSDPTITVPGPGTSGYSMKPLTASLSWPGGSGNNAVTTRSPRHFYVTCTGYSGLVAGNASTLYAGSNYIYIKCNAEL